jgi:ABC-type glycerol-3-phosphate transport system substrate-binding protein
MANFVSRRAFLRAVSLAGVGAGALALASCGGAASATASTAGSVATASVASTASSPPAVSAAASAGSTQATSSNVPTATGTTSSASAVAPAAGVTKGTTTVEYWDWWDPTGQPSLIAYFKQITAGFEAANPNLKLNITYPAFGDYEQKMLTSAASGTVPDVIHTSVAWTRGFWVKGVLQELSAKINLTPSMHLDQFVKSALFYNQYQGKVYGVPVEGPDSEVIMYNAQMFQQVGLDPAIATVNKWTWDEFHTNAVKLTQHNGGIVSVAGFDGVGADIYSLSEFGYGDGSSMYSQDQQTVGWNNAQGIETLQFLADVNSTKWQGSATWAAGQKAPTSKNGRIYDGTVAMALQGTWNVQQIKDFAPNLDLRIALLPRGPSGKANRTMSWENMIALPKGSKQQDAGWTFATYYGGKEALLIRLATTNRVGPRLDFYTSPEYQAQIKKTPNLQYVPQYGDVGGAYPFIEGTQINKVASPVLTQGATGKLSPADAIKQAAQLANGVLANPT